MAEQQNRTKTATLNLRIDEDLKVAAERAAAADRRSLTSYIEKLIEDDLRLKELHQMPVMIRAAPRSGRKR